MLAGASLQLQRSRLLEDRGMIHTDCDGVTALFYYDTIMLCYVL